MVFNEPYDYSKEVSKVSVTYVDLSIMWTYFIQDKNISKNIN